MNKNLVLERLLELIDECDEWLKFNSNMVLNYDLTICKNAVYANLKVPIKDSILGTRISLDTISLPLKGDYNSMRILLDLIIKNIKTNYTKEELNKELQNLSIYCVIVDRIDKAIELRVFYESLANRLSGILGNKYTARVDTPTAEARWILPSTHLPRRATASWS